MGLEDLRTDRFDNLDANRENDPRNEYQHDRDRLIHSAALRRLSGVTQVADPLEGHNFHNRLTHTLKVMQIAQRIAEYLLRQQEQDHELGTIINKLGGLDPEVVQAAALAHDIGLPPFGHTGEEALNRSVSQYTLDGFEGNAQTFRIVTKLAVRMPEMAGLNLTRATLRAIQKYPWERESNPPPEKAIRNRKWGAYETEREELAFARDLTADFGRERMSLEAAIMDMADDIAYATHDLEDFYRAHMIPLRLLFAHNPRQRNGEWNLSDEADDFLQYAEGRLQEPAMRERLDNDPDLIRRVFTERMWPFFYGIDADYRDTRVQKAYLRLVTAFMINRYVQSIRIDLRVADDPDARRVLYMANDHESGDDNDDLLLEIKLLKYLTNFYVHHNRALVTQQYGAQKIISELFDIFFSTAINDDTPKEILPPDYKELYDEEFQRIGGLGYVSQALHARIVADIISRMTDGEAFRLHHRLTGHTLGLATDFIL